MTARRDDFARAEGILAIEKAQNDVNNARKALNEEDGRVNKDTNLILELRNDLKEKEGILDRARLNNANNVLTVERAISTRSPLEQATISLFQQLTERSLQCSTVKLRRAILRASANGASIRVETAS